jgi:hypothetical protein
MQPVIAPLPGQYLDELGILIDPNNPKELEEAKSLVAQHKPEAVALSRWPRVCRPRGPKAGPG